MHRTPHALLTLAAVLLMQGCATSRDVRQADGWLTHVVSCGGPLLDMGHCIEKAGEVCGHRGYVVIHRISDDAPTSPENTSPQHTSAIPGGGWPKLPTSLAELKQFKSRQLHIQCH